MCGLACKDSLNNNYNDFYLESVLQILVVSITLQCQAGNA